MKRVSSITKLSSGIYMNGNSRFSPYIEFIVYNEELGICSKVQVEGRELSDLKKTIKAADKRADKRNEAI